MRIYEVGRREEEGEGSRVLHCIFMGNMGTPSRAGNVPLPPGQHAHIQSSPCPVEATWVLGLIYIINFEYFIVCLGKDTAGGTVLLGRQTHPLPNPRPSLAVAGPLSLDSGDAA